MLLKCCISQKQILCARSVSLFCYCTTDKPTQPLGPVEIIESSSTCIDFKWRPPKDDGGSPITDYILERQQIGRNSWKKLGKIGPEPKYRDTDVDHGRKYCYHIRAETDQGTSEMMETDDIQAGTKGEHLDKITCFWHYLKQNQKKKQQKRLSQSFDHSFSIPWTSFYT